MFKKCIIIGLPSMDLERPPAAIGILTSICQSKGIETSVFDLNLRMYNDLDVEEWRQAEQYWRLRKDPDAGVSDKINRLFETYVKEIQDLQPDLMLISVFTLMSNMATEKFLKLWHSRQNSKPVIIAGGQGLTTPYKVQIEQNEHNITTKSEIRFAEYLFDRKLIDHYVIGDGEDALLSILNSDFNCPGIDGIPPQQLENLDNYPIPNYALTDPNDYKYTASAGVYVTASRGCVRACKFCDVPDRWPKFKYRSGKLVAEEIITQHIRHGVTTFQLTDSVVNGNLNEFLAMNKTLAQYRKENNVELRLLGQFNIRPKRQMTQEQYRTAGEAGWRVFVTGVESGSERIRYDMGKDFSNEDIDWHMAQCAKWGIQNVALMFVGYPTETIEDHKENINFLYKYQKYMWAGTIAMIRWGYTGSIDIGSKLSVKNLGFDIAPQIPDLKLDHLMEHDQYWIYGRNWVSLKNPALTFEERIRRRLEVHEVSVELGYPLTRPGEELAILKKIVTEFKGKSDKHGKVVPIFMDVSDH